MHDTQRYLISLCFNAEGYTSISVREPLANIMAQTKAGYRQNQLTRPITDPHYATVSDDSGELLGSNLELVQRYCCYKLLLSVMIL